MSSTFTRSQNNPILKPNPAHDWESLKVYNPGVIYDGGLYHMFYRARGKDWVSRIGYAASKDAENFDRFDVPFLNSEGAAEKYGLEDPRITKIGVTYYMTYTAYDGETARLSSMTSPDFKQWSRHGQVFKNWDYTAGLNRIEYCRELFRRKFKIKKAWSKAGIIFHEKIDGSYFMFFGEGRIWSAISPDGLSWQPEVKPFLAARSGEYFDNNYVETGPPPIKTEKGWLVIYHGIDKKLTYRLGFLILDTNDPTKILHRSDKPIFEPREPYELSGIVDIVKGGYKVMENMNEKELADFVSRKSRAGKIPQVVFCNGAALVGDILRIYYGAGDSYICTASANIKNLLDI